MLVTTVFTAFLSASAVADNFYFRFKDSLVANVPGNSESPETAAIVLLGQKYRAGTTISGTSVSSLTSPTWSFTQTPSTPAIGFTAVEGGFVGTAPTVEDPTTFQVTAKAESIDKEAAADPVFVTVHPLLSVNGGPAGEIKGTVQTSLGLQPAYVIKGLVETAAYTLMQSAAPLANFSTLCPGLSFSATDGNISGTPTDACSLQNLTIKVKDSFDNAEATSGAFSVSIALAPSNVMAWGNNSYGQIGDGTEGANKLAPIPLLGRKNYMKIAGGNSHACGLLNDGTVDCWGLNDYGQLGNGTTESSSIPSKVSGLSGVTDLVSGLSHTCAIVSGGALKCWGDNQYGQLGNGNTTTQTTPVQVSGMTSGVTAIATGYYHSCGVVGGAQKCWGNNEYGQLGNGNRTQQLTPVDVSGLTSGVTSIIAGGHYACAIVSGSAKCWGSNYYYQIGNGNNVDQWTPVQVSGLTSGVTAMSSNWGHTCAIVYGGMKCWGHNHYGQIGNGDTTNQTIPTPVQVSGLTSGVTSIATGAYHTCAVVAGIAKCWGDNEYGQLGIGNMMNHALPVQVSGLNSVSAITAGGYSTYAW